MNNKFYKEEVNDNINMFLGDLIRLSNDFLNIGGVYG